MGDFNYDGSVNSLDFVDIATNFNAPLTLPSISLGSIVPEPSSILLTAVPFLVPRQRTGRALGIVPATVRHNRADLSSRFLVSIGSPSLRRFFSKREIPGDFGKSLTRCLAEFAILHRLIVKARTSAPVRAPGVVAAPTFPPFKSYGRAALLDAAAQRVLVERHWRAAIVEIFFRREDLSLAAHCAKVGRMQARRKL